MQEEATGGCSLSDEGTRTLTQENLGRAGGHRAGQGGPRWREGHRSQADLQDVVNGPVECGGPTSAWGGCETQHLGQGPCPLEFVLQIPAQDDVVDGIFVCVVTLIHDEQGEGWGVNAGESCDLCKALLPLLQLFSM